MDAENQGKTRIRSRITIMRGRRMSFESVVETTKYTKATKWEVGAEASSVTICGAV
jgi:hypothetical protein